VTGEVALERDFSASFFGFPFLISIPSLLHAHLSIMLFNDAVSISGYIVSNGRMMKDEMKELGRGHGLTEVLSQHMPEGTV
jgi:hypothetical protein